MFQINYINEAFLFIILDDINYLSHNKSTSDKFLVGPQDWWEYHV